jgi:hypothetical protein
MVQAEVVAEFMHQFVRLFGSASPVVPTLRSRKRSEIRMRRRAPATVDDHVVSRDFAPPAHIRVGPVQVREEHVAVCQLKVVPRFVAHAAYTEEVVLEVVELGCIAEQARAKQTAGVEVYPLEMGDRIVDSEMQSDPVDPIGIRDRSSPEGVDDVVERVLVGTVSEHEVNLDEHVLVKEVRSWKNDVEVGVHIGIDAALYLPAIEQTVAIVIRVAVAVAIAVASRRAAR